ncbi:MAG: hypothetical protein HYU35_00245 [Parcubacteria group bacterium]|nr:hypothetical protein [Parcubacteria group bacterium]
MTPEERLMMSTPEGKMPGNSSSCTFSNFHITGDDTANLTQRIFRAAEAFTQAALTATVDIIVQDGHVPSLNVTACIVPEYWAIATAHLNVLRELMHILPAGLCFAYTGHKSQTELPTAAEVNGHSPAQAAVPSAS